MNREEQAQVCAAYFGIINDDSMSVQEIKAEEGWLKEIGILDEAQTKYSFLKHARPVIFASPSKQNGDEPAVLKKRRTGERAEGGEEDELEEGEVKRQRLDA